MNILETQNLKKYFPVRRKIFGKEEYVKALDGVSISIEKGEIYSIVGETGSGKTTLARIITGLTEPTDGKVFVDGIDIFSLKKSELKNFRKKVQIIFQDPYGSLNPRFKVKDIVEEPLKLNKLRFDENKIINVLENVGLKPAEDFLNRYPHQLSGGQRQRVAIARALAVDPEFIVADEPVSMLDVSIRANFLNLMMDMNRKLGISVMMITHDISVATYVAKRLSVLYLGKIVETGSKYDITNNSLHPYTQALFQAIPTLGKKEKDVKILGDIPNPMNIPKGCRFHNRCPYAMDICRIKEPPLKEIKQGHFVACHLY